MYANPNAYKTTYLSDKYMKLGADYVNWFYKGNNGLSDTNSNIHLNNIGQYLCDKMKRL